MKKRIGLIGLGNIAEKVYLPLLSQMDSVEIVGMMSTTDTTVVQVGKKYRLSGGTTQLATLLAQELDAVFVHSPTETHYEIIKKCFLQGIPVYVDKPLSYEWEQSVELASLAEKKGLLLAVGFNRRFAPLYMEAKSWVDQVGGFEWCSAQKHRTRQQSCSAKLTIYDDLIHMLDLLIWLGGTSYTREIHLQNVDEAGRLLHASGSLSFNTSVGTYSMARQSGFDLEKFELHGNGRSVEVTNLQSANFYEKGALPQSKTFGSWETTLYRRGFVGVVEHFLQCLDSPQECSIRADLVLETHQLVEKLIADNF